MQILRQYINISAFYCGESFKTLQHYVKYTECVEYYFDIFENALRSLYAEEQSRKSATTIVALSFGCNRLLWLILSVKLHICLSKHLESL